MMRHVTKHDCEMSEELPKWMECDEDGRWYLREDAPDDVKEYYDKLEEEYEDL